MAKANQWRNIEPMAKSNIQLNGVDNGENNNENNDNNESLENMKNEKIEEINRHQSKENVSSMAAKENGEIQTVKISENGMANKSGCAIDVKMAS
jgi:hypothetical protein